jgi:flagellar motor switch protein FliG
MDSEESEKVDGVGIAANILSAMEIKRRYRIVNLIEKASPQSASKIKLKLHDFSRLAKMPAINVAYGLRQANDNDIAISLKTLEPSQQKLVLNFLSSRRQSAVQEIASTLPPLKLSLIERAQERIFHLVENAVLNSNKTAL